MLAGARAWLTYSDEWQGKACTMAHKNIVVFTLRAGLLVHRTIQMTKKWCETDSAALDRKEYYQERRLRELQLDLPLEVTVSAFAIDSRPYSTRL